MLDVPLSPGDAVKRYSADCVLMLSKQVKDGLNASRVEWTTVIGSICNLEGERRARSIGPNSIMSPDLTETVSVSCLHKYSSQQCQYPTLGILSASVCMLGFSGLSRFL